MIKKEVLYQRIHEDPDKAKFVVEHYYKNIRHWISLLDKDIYIPGLGVLERKVIPILKYIDRYVVNYLRTHNIHVLKRINALEKAYEQIKEHHSHRIERPFQDKFWNPDMDSDWRKEVDKSRREERIGGGIST